MKKPSPAIIKSYSIAIIRSLKNDLKTIQTVIIELNQILNTLFKAGLVNNTNYSQICEAVSKTTLSPETKNIIKILCDQKRLDLLKIILENILETFCKISTKNAIVICSSDSDFKTICEHLTNTQVLQTKNCIILHNFVDYRDNLIIKINDKVVDFSIESCVNKMKLQSIKLINTILI